MSVADVNASEFTKTDQEEAGMSDTFHAGNFIGQNESLLKILKILEKVSKTDSTVLVTGESGTGKELVARAIHSNSSRKNDPFVVINCGAIPGELLESELFGHEKGAFTGATKSRSGRFEVADGGTVFLDEIGDMSPDLQVKLLRVLQEKCFEKVGSTRSIHVDVRIISATNKDLPVSIKKGLFREDLFYRLNVIPIKMPPLRNRKSDIPILADHFQEILARRLGSEKKEFSREALDLLIQYRWPGNVRELENIMERLAVLAEGKVIMPGDLPAMVSESSCDQQQSVSDFMNSGMGFNESVEQYQRSLILYALEKTGWVKAKAAALLKLNRTTLVEKLKKMKISKPEKKEPGFEIIDYPS